MGKTAKRMRSDKKKQEKRRFKLARRAFYESLRGTSKNKKRKGKCVANNHPKWSSCHEDNCGNIGCKRCFPYLIRKR